MSSNTFTPQSTVGCGGAGGVLTVGNGNTSGCYQWPQPSVTWTLAPQPKTPYCCPVCHGRGVHPPEFYAITEKDRAAIVERALSDGLDAVTCRSCEGKGYVWG